MITPPLSEITRPDYIHIKTCIGITQRGARCGNAVAASNANLALSNLQDLGRGYQKLSPQKLMYCAGLLLCKRYHQCQASGIVEDWLAENSKRRVRAVQIESTFNIEPERERRNPAIGQYSYNSDIREQETRKLMTSTTQLKNDLALLRRDLDIAKQSPSTIDDKLQERSPTSDASAQTENIKPTKISPTISTAKEADDVPRTPNRPRYLHPNETTPPSAQPAIFTKSTENSLKSNITTTSSDDDEVRDSKQDDSPCASKSTAKACDILLGSTSPPRHLSSPSTVLESSQNIKEERDDSDDEDDEDDSEDDLEDDLDDIKDDSNDDSEADSEDDKENDENDEENQQDSDKSGVNGELETEQVISESKADTVETLKTDPNDKQRIAGHTSATNAKSLSQPRKYRPIFIKSRKRSVRRHSSRTSETRQTSASLSSTTTPSLPELRFSDFNPGLTDSTNKHYPHFQPTTTPQPPPAQITDFFSAIQDIQAVCFSMMQKSIDEIAQAAISRHVEGCCVHSSPYSLSTPPSFARMSSRLPAIERSAHTFARDVLVAVPTF